MVDFKKVQTLMQLEKDVRDGTLPWDKLSDEEIRYLARVHFRKNCAGDFSINGYWKMAEAFNCLSRNQQIDWCKLWYNAVSKSVVISVTGHRPGKLYGYDIYNKQWTKLKEKFKALLIENGCTEAVTGMALGVDTVFALAVLELKAEGHNIKLHCAIPCRNHSSKWIQESVNLYNDILSKADAVKIVTDAKYQPWMMQKRNEYMVDLSDKVIAVWDGSPSGTANCVKYAEKCGKEIIRIAV